MNNNNIYSFITYVLLFILIVTIFSLSFKYKFKRAHKLSFRSLTNKNSNAVVKENYSNIKEGFREGLDSSNYNKKETDNVFKLIDNKLQGLMQELGGTEGKKETKKILTNTKKICDLECAKCMMMMINDKKSFNTINIDGILDDETDENCIKCKKYTALSTSITSIIDNL